MRFAGFSILVLLGAMLCLGQPQQSTSTLSGACKNGGDYPGNCVGGEVVFTGSNYDVQVHVTVTNSAGQAIDDGDYTTNAGVLKFTENLSFSDTYTIRINAQVALTVTTGS